MSGCDKAMLTKADGLIIQKGFPSLLSSRDSRLSGFISQLILKLLTEEKDGISIPLSFIMNHINLAVSSLKVCVFEWIKIYKYICSFDLNGNHGWSLLWISVTKISSSSLSSSPSSSPSSTPSSPTPSSSSSSSLSEKDELTVFSRIVFSSSTFKLELV